MNRYTHVIWDWNGTLFDDAEWCVKVINSMLEKRSLRTFGGVGDYRGIFRFPVKEYYRDAGFDFEKEPFEQLAAEFIAAYHAGDRENCRLHTNTEPVLRELSRSRVTQAVLSASEKTNLTRQISYYNIRGYFDEVLGLSDFYAKSKVDIGLDYISRGSIKNAVLIGDTLHDYETAQALGVDCVLIANGHQSRERLGGAVVLNDISEVLGLWHD